MEKNYFAGRPVLVSHAEQNTSELLTTSAAVLPEQFYNPPAQTTGRGEVALMRAVLEEAVDCFQKQFVKNGRRAQRLAREAEEWIHSDELRWPFSFVNICAVLGLEPGYIRLKLKHWRENVSVTAQMQVEGPLGMSSMSPWGRAKAVALRATD